MPRRLFLLVGGLFLLVGIAGCSGDPNEQDSFSSDSSEVQRADIQGTAKELEELGNVEQAAAFSDGNITEKEYKDALTNLLSCIEGSGYSFSEPILSPVTGITYEFTYNVNGRDEATALQDFESCEAQYWNPLASTYLALHGQRMDEQLKAAVLTCMEQDGYPGNKNGINLAEISPLVGDDDQARNVARECTKNEAMRLYPEILSVTVYD